MLFNSYVFLYLFLPAALLTFQASLRWAHPAAPMQVLIALSLVFYAWWSPLYLLLLLASVAINFLAAHHIQRAGAASDRVIAVGVGLNLALLGYFKYRGFFVQIINDVAGHGLLPVPEVFLPLAISFYTFQQIAFLVDIHRRHMAPPPLLEYMAAVTFFPHLIAGPIVQYREILPQFSSLHQRRVSLVQAAQGLALFGIGLFKKTVIADSCGRLADRIFAAPLGMDVGMADAWIATLGFSLQLYFDFSAYSDMALGLGCLFGITLPRNFDSPYKARDITDFWRRWHITLGAFLRDYLYVALGGNRKGPTRTLVNLFLTMVLGGLWHGAGWTFLIWGALHGAYLVVHRVWSRWGWTLHRAVAWPLTMSAVALAWAVFRVEGVGHAAHMVQVLLGFGHSSSQVFRGEDLLVLALAATVVMALPNAVRWVRGETPTGAGFCASGLQTALITILLCAGLLQVGAARSFIYFNF